MIPARLSFRYEFTPGEIFIPVRKLIPMSRKRGTTVRSDIKPLYRGSFRGSGTGSVCVFDM